MNNFQTILTAIFIAFFVLAVLVFSGAINFGASNSKSTLSGKIVVWGTFPDSSVLHSFDAISKNNQDLSISYQQKNPATYQQDLIEAFANGAGPDLFILSSGMIIKNSNFIYKVPYTSYPEKVFRQTFVDGADIYLDKSGILGFPIIVDPMVLYYNKDILTNNGIVYPPKTWDELFVLNSTLTRRDSGGAISQSMIALGQYENVNNAKDILATLLLENNNPIVLKGSDNKYTSVLNNSLSDIKINPLETVVRFYTEFTNPSDTAYSWNLSLPSSLDMFTGGRLAFYLGRASELFNIQSTNPNLSFDVAQIPQIKDSTTKRTFGEIYAVAVNKKSSNITSAFGVALSINQGDDAKNFSTALSLPPASRALLANKPADPYLFTFFDSAVISRAWLDPDYVKSDVVFKDLIGSVLSNNLSIGEATNKAQGQLSRLLGNLVQ